MNATLEEMARMIFKSWFVDFDPVRAKAAGHQPAGMDAATVALFPDSFEVIEEREVPRGWKIDQLGQLLTLDKGISYKGEYLSNSGVPMINLGCFLGDGEFSAENIKFYNGEFRKRHEVHAGDLVLANTDITQRRDVIGSPAIVPSIENHDQIIFSHHVFAARFPSKREDWKQFVYFTLLQPSFRERAMGFATGTTVLALPKDAVLNLSFIAPRPNLISAFNKITAPLLGLIQKNTNQSLTIAALRDSLLPKLLSGELQVRDAERWVESVV